LSTSSPGFNDPLAQSEDNSKYFTASFGRPSTEQQIQDFSEEESSESSSEDDSEESGQNSLESIEEITTQNQPMNINEPSTFTKSIQRILPTSSGPSFSVDRVETSRGKKRGGRLGMVKKGISTLQQEDIDNLIVNNAALNRELDDEARGFALN